ncbi:hypothetical protein LXL04_003707 [Taraxacum kok-saghyz]
MPRKQYHPTIACVNKLDKGFFFNELERQFADGENTCSYDSGFIMFPYDDKQAKLSFKKDPTGEGHVYTWKHDEARIVKAVSGIFTIGELPFKFVENETFIELINACNGRTETEKVSCSTKPLVHQFTRKILDIELHLRTWSTDPGFVEMVPDMKEKYDNYWGDYEKMSDFVFFAVLLDYQCKSQFYLYTSKEMIGYTKKQDMTNSSIELKSREMVRETERKMEDPFETYLEDYDTGLSSKQQIPKQVVDCDDDKSTTIFLNRPDIPLYAYTETVPSALIPVRVRSGSRFLSVQQTLNYSNFESLYLDPFACISAPKVISFTPNSRVCRSGKENGDDCSSGTTTVASSNSVVEKPQYNNGFRNQVHWIPAPGTPWSYNPWVPMPGYPPIQFYPSP